MHSALKLARRGFGRTSPNPRVGAVLVRDGTIIARGHHKAYGELHAEATCLTKISEPQAQSATLYVNLEPCCHFGKTPPCTETIIASGVRRLVYGTLDPNPLVNGQGVERLRQAGIEVAGPVLEHECQELNRGYFKFRRTNRPWVTLKWAQSLDGRLATSTGDSRWISGPKSLKLAHQLRAEHDAVLVGINTVLTDDPQLTVRQVKGLDPLRIVLDPELKCQPEAAMFRAGSAPILMATRAYPPLEKAQRLQDQGAEIIWLPAGQGGALDLNELLDHLGRRGILYLLVEGGSKVFASFIRQNLFDEMIIVTAPLIIGAEGVPSAGALGITRLNQALKFSVVHQKSLDRDRVLWLRPQN